MRFGVREICNIVFKAKNDVTMGSKTFKKDEPVIYFDSAKVSDLSGTATSVYAQGGRGNPKLITWEGEKNVTFSFTDALISALGIAILTGADLFENKIFQKHVTVSAVATAAEAENVKLDLTAEITKTYGESVKITTPAPTNGITLFVYKSVNGNMEEAVEAPTVLENVISASSLVAGDTYIVDCYVQLTGTQLEVLPEKFSDYFYIEADTLFRRESDGADLAAQFSIPKGKVQSAFTFAMANTGDPSTFDFTVDAMSDFVKGSTKKVLFRLDIAE